MRLRWQDELAVNVRDLLTSRGLIVNDRTRLRNVANGCVALATTAIAHPSDHKSFYSTMANDNWLGRHGWLLLVTTLAVIYLTWRLSAGLQYDADDGGGDEKPVEVLALFANPMLPEQAPGRGLRPLAFGQDLKMLMHALPHSELEVEPAATLLNAHQALIRSQPRYLLFSGHTIMGALAFETPEGRLDTHAAPEYFVSLLADLAHSSHSSSRARALVLRDEASGAAVPEASSPDTLCGAAVPEVSSPDTLSLDQRLEASSRDEASSRREEASSRMMPGRRSGRLQEESYLPTEQSAIGRRDALSDHLESLRTTAAQRIQSYARGFGVRKSIPGGHIRRFSEARRRGEHTDLDAKRIVEQLRGRRAGVLPSLRSRSEALSRLGCVVLNGCDTVDIGRAVLDTLPGVAVVCWETVAEDSAARAFAMGFYGAIAEGLQRRRLQRLRLQGDALRAPIHIVRRGLAQVLPASWARLAGDDGDGANGLELQCTLAAFDAGCHAFLSAGFKFGDPAAYLHPPSHPHNRRPNFLNCEGCTPPVHGSVVLMYTNGGKCIERRGSDVKSPLQTKRRSLANFAMSLADGFLADRQVKQGRKNSKSLTSTHSICPPAAGPDSVLSRGQWGPERVTRATARHSLR